MGRVRWDGLGWDGQDGMAGALAGDGMAPHAWAPHGEEWARFGWQLHVPVMYSTLITTEH